MKNKEWLCITAENLCQTLIEIMGLQSPLFQHGIKGLITHSSFNVENNRTEEEKELVVLRKKVKQLKKEKDVLKQAALILRRK